MSQHKTRVLGTFSLAMITIAAIVGLRNLPLTAELGYSSGFFLIIAGIIFFIPSALVVAELAATWPRPGGCYVWVEEAYGKPLAFISLWMSWMASVAWFPTILAFTASMLGHLLAPILPGVENNLTFILITMLLVFWGTTLSNFLGIEFSGVFSAIGVVAGTLIPGALIIVLGFWWWFAENPMQITLNFQAMIPDFKMDNIILFAAVLLSLSGIELASFHIREAKNPQRSYPRAMAISAFCILLIYVLGTLAIVMVVPENELDLASGLIQAFTVFFTKVGATWAVPLLALILLIGAVAQLNAWVIGPAKGMLVVAQDGFLPAWLKTTNAHGVPTTLLIMQGIIGSVLAMLFYYMRNNNAAIWFVTAMSAQFTVGAYLLIFCAALKLRRSQPDIVRAFRTPAMNVVATVGIVACIFSFCVVYVPHAKLVTMQHNNYCILLTITFILLLAPALILILFRNRSKPAKLYS